MNYSEIKHFDIANGPGIRTSLFVSGCRLRCRGCFNAVAWSFSSGREFTAEVGDGIIRSVLNPFMDGITILGGEPTEPENQEGLVDFLERARVAFGPRGEGSSKTIWLFSGHTWDQLIDGGTQHGPYTDRILACVDVLVDGPFMQEEYDISLRFRGSANQRIIDVPKTLEKGEVVLWHDELTPDTPSVWTRDSAPQISGH